MQTDSMRERLDGQPVMLYLNHIPQHLRLRAQCKKLYFSQLPLWTQYTPVLLRSKYTPDLTWAVWNLLSGTKTSC